MNGQIQGKVHVRDIESSTQSGSQTASTERQYGLEVRKEEASRNMVRSAMKVTVIIQGELIVPVLAGFAKHELAAGRGVGVGE